MKVRIMPYKMGSQGASRLAEGLREKGIRCLKVYPDRNYYPRKGHFLINWGLSTRPDWYASRFCSNMLNKPPNVALASNKLHAFQAWKSWNEAVPDALVPIPDFTTDINIANRWHQNGYATVCRFKLSGHSGAGIHLEPPHENGVISNAPLYVKYIKKNKEYRIHVFRGEVIDIQEKRKRRDIPNEEVNYQIRSHDRGWVFCRSDVTPPDGVRETAINAVRALGLDFGAVDIIYNQHYSLPYVLEVNTSPGLENTTVDVYVNAIRRIL